MTYNRELLKADILDELAKLQKLEAEFARPAALLSHPPEDVPFFERSAVGYYLHSFYNGCENIFRLVARFFENDVGPQSWHTDLLKRMKLTIPGFRPALIDDALYQLLDDFRGFRHRFRHGYTFELDWEKERMVAEKFYSASRLMHEQTIAFLACLEQFDRSETD